MRSRAVTPTRTLCWPGTGFASGSCTSPAETSASTTACCVQAAASTRRRPRSLRASSTSTPARAAMRSSSPAASRRPHRAAGRGCPSPGRSFPTSARRAASPSSRRARPPRPSTSDMGRLATSTPGRTGPSRSRAAARGGVGWFLPAVTTSSVAFAPPATPRSRSTPRLECSSTATWPSASGQPSRSRRASPHATSPSSSAGRR